MDSAGASSGVSGWFVAGVIALVVGIGCFVLLWWLRRRRTSGQKSEEPALAEAWERAVDAMPASERDSPVVVVLGERLSGKSTLIRGALRPCERVTPDGGDLDVYAGGGQRVQEISGDLLLDPRKEAEDALRKLWKRVALSALRVVVVVNARSLTWNEPGLRDLGRVVRRKVDLLADLRDSPVNVRVAVTHLDGRHPGFVPFCEVLERTNERRPIPHQDASAAVAAWRRVAPRGASTAQFPAVVDFVTAESGAALRSLDPFFEMLLSPARNAPIIDGVFLSASPPEQRFCATGDALAADEDLAERDARARFARLARRVLLAAAALALLFAIVFTTQRTSVDRTEDAVAVLEDAVKRGATVPRTTEQRAAAAVLEMRRSGVLFGERRSDVEARYEAAVRESKLLPPLRSTDRASRIRALAVLDAGPNDPLREQILKDKEAWAKALGMLPETLDAYFAVSDGAGPSDEELEKLPPITSAPRGSSLDDWSGFFERYSNVLGGQRLDEKGLAALQSEAGDLSRAVDDAAAQTQLAEIAATLQERHPRQKDLFGPGAAGDAGPWMTENAATLRPLLQAVQAGSLDGPSGAGKGLREAVSDLQVIAVPPVFVAEAKAAEPQAATTSPTLLDRAKRLIAPVASAAPALPSASPSALPSASAASSASATAAPSASAAGSAQPAAEAEPKKQPVFQVTLSSKQWTFDMALWAKAIVAGRAIRYLDALFADAGTRSVLFPKDAVFSPVLPSPGRGATHFIDGPYTHEAFTAEVEPGLQGFEKALDPAGLSSSERETYLRPARKAADDHAKGLRDAIDAYYRSFQLSSGGAAALAADVADMVSPASFFTDFLKRVADQATMPAEPSALLRPIADKVADYGPIVRLMQGDKGKYPALEPYYKLLIALIPSLADRAAPAVPQGSPLDARLAPIGALALSAVRDPAKSPDAQVEAWLNDASIPESLRRPFRLPVQRALALGKADLDRAVQDAYSKELLPGVTPLLEKFPFNSRSQTDARAADVEAAFGPKGTFFASFSTQIGPVCKEGPPGTFVPLEVPTAGAVSVPAGALRLASWATNLSKMLFAADGKPQPIALQVKAPPLDPVGLERTITSAFLVAGAATFHAFNQAPAWYSFPVQWYPGDEGPTSATVGIKTMQTGGGEPHIDTIDTAASEWSFFRLLQQAETAGSSVTWSLPPEYTGGPRRYAAFIFQPAPAGLFRPPALP